MPGQKACQGSLKSSKATSTKLWKDAPIKNEDATLSSVLPWEEQEQAKVMEDAARAVSLVILQGTTGFAPKAARRAQVKVKAKAKEANGEQTVWSRAMKRTGHGKTAKDGTKDMARTTRTTTGTTHGVRTAEVTLEENQRTEAA